MRGRNGPPITSGTGDNAANATISRSFAVSVQTLSGARKALLPSTQITAGATGGMAFFCRYLVTIVRTEARHRGGSSN